MTNNVVLVSGVQQSDPVIHIHVSILFQILFPFKFLHNIEQSSLCYKVGPCWLSILFIYLSFYLFIFGCVGSLLLRVGFPLVAASGSYYLLRCAGFSLWWPLLLQSMGSRCVGFSSCGTWAQ